MWNLCCVVVCHGSMVNWRRGWGQSVMKLTWCSGLTWMYAQWEERVGSICHGYMCIVLCMKLLWCNGFPEIYAWLGGHSDIGICALCYILNLFAVMVFQRSMLNWIEGCQSAMGRCALCYIWNLLGVMVLQRSMLDWRRGSICIGICALFYIYIYISICH